MAYRYRGNRWLLTKVCTNRIWQMPACRAVAESRNQTNGTLIRDGIGYGVGFGLVGPVAQELLLGRQLQRTFVYRQAALTKLLG